MSETEWTPVNFPEALELSPQQWRERCLLAERSLAILTAERVLFSGDSAKTVPETQGHLDLLTGTPDRQTFQERLRLALLQSQQTQRPVGVATLDLDGFKAVNERFGHDFADRLLREIAQRLQGSLRDRDLLARHVGDEFMVLLPSMNRAEDTWEVGERLRKIARTPVEIEGHEISLTASIGLAVAPQDGLDVLTLLRNADIARYEAKNIGRDTCFSYNSALQARFAGLVETRAHMRRALERDEIRVFYQPQVVTCTGELVGLEALVRWMSPDEGLLLPGRFIPAIEGTNLIDALGEKVLRLAMAQSVLWKSMGLWTPRIAVNMSTHQFLDVDLVPHVRAILEDAGLEPEALEIEVTESAAISDPPRARKILGQFRDMGISVVLDDFGMGFSSLSNLVHLPFQRLKIDRSFLMDLETNPIHRTVVETIIHLGKRLHMDVVAEGVETQGQIQFLRDRGCLLAQGFGIARPAPVETISALLAHSHVSGPFFLATVPAQG